MSENPYERVKGGRLTFRGGALATATSSKNITKTKKNKKNKKINQLDSQSSDVLVDGSASGTASTATEVVYTIDAAKNMKYEELFPVETKKFGYDPKAKVKSVEDALDERIKKKADRYCK